MRHLGASDNRLTGPITGLHCKTVRVSSSTRNAMEVERANPHGFAIAVRRGGRVRALAVRHLADSSNFSGVQKAYPPQVVSQKTLPSPAARTNSSP